VLGGIGQTKHLPAQPTACFINPLGMGGYQTQAGISAQRRHLPLKPEWLGNVIIILQCDKFAPGRGDAGVVPGGNPSVMRQAHKPHAWIASSAAQRLCAQPGSIVDQDEFPILKSLVDHARDRLRHKRIQAVENHDDGNSWHDDNLSRKAVYRNVLSGWLRTISYQTAVKHSD